MKEYAKSFYKSKAWKSARQQAIIRADGLCERCRAKGIYKPGCIVHHKKYITPENIGDSRITLDLCNLEYVCEDCHNKEHKAKHNTRYSFDANGNMLPPPQDQHPPGVRFWTDPKEPRELHPKNAAGSGAYEGG